MKKIIFLFAMAVFVGCKAETTPSQETAPKGTPKVYFTRDISPESLVKIYEAVCADAEALGGRVAVKISTGEGGNTHYLKPTFIRGLVEKVNGTIVECNTAYGGSRASNEKHWQTIREHGFDSIFAVDLMDETGEMRIPVQDHKHLRYNIVGDHLSRYDAMINLAHFKGHAMGGFGGVLKNQSIGVASASGKAYIHSAGYTTDIKDAWNHIDDQDGFLESMAAASQAVANYFNGRIIYIDVMNNMSVDCDCDGSPASPELKDMGIMASVDPVAVDQACIDKVFNHDSKDGDTSKPLIERINSRHGTHILEYAEQIGLGSRKYELIDLDQK